ncbi:MAG TPA: SOS response-associated peptidase [Acidimicrobiales bacterium]|nr:SOS response-associated peptidase [Acidimicrobiales bacterium]
MLRRRAGAALMCGRVVAASPREVLAARLGVAEIVGEELPARWNVAPGSQVYAVAGTRRGRRMGPLWWGLVPSWVPDPSTAPRPMNARAESLLERPTFEGALAGRRCVVPVDGFYEWQTAPAGCVPERRAGRQPWFLAPADGGPMAIAAVWDRWTGDGSDPHVSCALITTPANDEVSPLHDRMPAIVPPDDWEEWLDPANRDVERLRGLLRPAPPGRLSSRPVSRLVNRVGNEGPELLSDPEPPATAFGPRRPAALSLFSNDSR